MRIGLLLLALTTLAVAAPVRVEVWSHGARAGVDVRSSRPLRVTRRNLPGQARTRFSVSPAELQSAPGERLGVEVRQTAPHTVEVTLNGAAVGVERPSPRQLRLGFTPLTGAERTLVTDTFVRADLGRVVEYLAGRMGRRVSWGPDVGGMVTVRFQSVPLEEALLTVLHMVDERYRYRLVGAHELRIERGF